MKIQTFSIIAGSKTCNASCPYCVSKMTGFQGITDKVSKINWLNFEKACRLAKINQVASVIITGKGEPTLYPEQITDYLQNLKKFEFPLIELQTNGLLLGYKFRKFKKYLEEWHDLGLGLVAISVVDSEPSKNALIYTPKKRYIDLRKLIIELHCLGYSVRLSCTLIKGLVDSSPKVLEISEYAKSLGVEQLSLRPVIRPIVSEDQQVYEWVGDNLLSENQISEIRDFLDQKAKRLITYGHGSVLYDLNGQNVCLTNALTIKPESDDIRQLIFFPDGHLRFDWQYKGAVIL